MALSIYDSPNRPVSVKRQLWPSVVPYGLPWGEIVGIIHERRREGTPLFNAMSNVRTRYNGPALDFVLPWWSGVDGELQNSQFIPLLIAELVDTQALQAASVEAEIFSPSKRPGVQKGPGSREYAQLRRGALMYTYHKSRWPLAARRLFRQLSAYGSCCAMVMPDDRLEMPRVEVRDALTAFPDQRAAEDFRDHENIGFITGRSADWLRARYPEVAAENGGPITRRAGDDRQMWDVLEWIDEWSVVIGLMGPRETRFGTSTWADGYEQSMMELRRWPNKAGMMPAMIPAKVTLDMVMSQIMNLTGHVDLMAKMQLIDVIQSEKALQPDFYMLGADGRAPRIISNGGEWAEGREGKINELMNVQAVGQLNGQPDPLARATIDRVERNAKLGQMTPQMGGESHGPLRTGRAIDEMHTIAVEPRIQEMHEIMEAHRPTLNEAILRTYDGYYGSKVYSMYTGKTAARSQFEFVPNEHCEDVYDTSVTYAIAGAGVVETNVVLMQMLGGEMMGKKSAMRRHPWIDDAEAMIAEMDEEEIESMVKAVVFNQVNNKEAPAEMLMFLEEERRNEENADIIAAWGAAHRRLQELQASQAPPPGEGQVLPPEMMPGANAGPDGAMMQPPPDPAMLGPGAQGVTPGQAGMREMFNALRSTGQELA